MKLPTAEDGMSRLQRLQREKDFRQKAIFRLYPGCKIRGGAGNPWDMHGPDVVLVVFDEKNTHGVHYDHELTLLSRAITEEIRKTLRPSDMIGADNTKPWPQHDHPIIQMNQYFDLLVSCACDEETWQRDDVQDAYARMMRKEPLDRIVDALNEE